MARHSPRTLGTVLVSGLGVGLVAVGCSGSSFSASPAAGGDAAGGSISGGRGGAGADVSAGAGGVGLGAGASNGGSVNGAGTGTGTGGTDAGAAGGGAGGAPVGAGGVSEAGAAGELGGVGGSCEPVAWFPDGDGDGFGRSSGQVTACQAPTSGAWVTIGGDCNDDNKAVFPGQTAFKAVGYTSSGSAVSFDYDCSGIEQVDPTEEGGAPACNNVLSCTGSGFQATNRSGPGVNALCGSTALVTCTKATLACSAVVTQVAEGIRCH